MHSRKGIRFASKLAFRLFDKSDPVLAVGTLAEQKGQVIFGDYAPALKKRLKSPAIRKRSPRKTSKSVR